MITRDLEAALAEVSKQYPVLTLTGPRQSGKTTLCRGLFSEHAFVSLERPDMAQRAREDPRGLLQQYAGGAVFDEVQNVPELLSYLQVEVDEDPAPGRFVLTGSQHFGLTDAIAQSLAGRTAVLHLLPPSLRELRRFDELPDDLFELMRIGSFPRIWDRGLDPGRWLADYTATYVQRDVRQVLDVGNLEAFTTFVRLCAGRTAQEVNLSELGGDAGVSHNTARSWLSVLETSYVVFRLPAFHLNVRKQLIKAPKLHFVDTGLACYLLGIRTADELRLHPLRGALFESWVAAEIYKQIAHAGSVPRLSHYRETRGAEVDVVVDPGGQRLIAVDAKSGSTVQPSFLRGLRRFVERLSEAKDGRDVESRIVYGGDEEQRRSDTRVVPWARITDVDWT